MKVRDIFFVIVVSCLDVIALWLERHATAECNEC